MASGALGMSDLPGLIAFWTIHLSGVHVVFSATGEALKLVTIPALAVGLVVLRVDVHARLAAFADQLGAGSHSHGCLGSHAILR